MWIKKSLFAKLLLGMLIASIIPFSLSNVVSYRTTSEGIRQKTIELNLKTMSLALDNVKRYMHELSLDMVAYYQDTGLMDNLRKTEVSAALQFQIREQLNQLYGSRAEIRAVRYINTQINQTIMLYNNAQVGSLSSIADTFVPKHHSQWDDSKEFEVAELGKERVLVMHKPLVDYPKSTVLGLTTLYIGIDKIASVLGPLAEPSSGEQTFLYVKDSQNLLYASGGEDAQEMAAASFVYETGSFEGTLHGEQGIYIYLKDTHKELPLTIAKFVPMDLIYKSANQMLSRVLVIQLLGLGFVIVLTAILTFIIIKPIRRLIRMIRRVESGNFNMEPMHHNVDELGVLEHRFQTMVRNLDELVIKDYRNKLEVSTARLKMLQAQINPHFLYNTLQMIGTLALRKGVVEVNDKITELGSILRYSMDLETENVPLGREIQQMEDYLSLQKSRFNHRLSYTISCPPGALPLRVPKMILQPLVENSVIHGFEKGKGSGVLHIAIEWSEEKLYIRVIDNGKGFDPQTVRLLKEEYASTEPYQKQHGIGLMNVLHRLQLLYGTGFEWDIRSIPYESTAISLGISTDLLTTGGEPDESIDRR
ncbi:sensor histidine kinase [Paenibacillus sp. GCM10012307]|uniref:Histidine kinase n=2 Tax=Paenibacillus TaxID=44249 RepID=A0A934MK43_9BACL|nr:histidine kinase [Paenibacillus roseus]MBJ6360625.1 histidine kinase [Paenibacillus roseus]